VHGLQHPGVTEAEGWHHLAWVAAARARALGARQVGQASGNVPGVTAQEKVCASINGGCNTLRAEQLKALLKAMVQHSNRRGRVVIQMR